jgi:hypothetical protein
MSRKKSTCILLTLFSLLVILSFVVIKIIFVGNSKTLQPNNENGQTDSQQLKLKVEPTIDEDVVRCPADVKKCPDGSYVSRIPPNCTFALCEGLKKTQ